MLKTIKRWWVRLKIKELQEAYSYNYFMYGYYADCDRAYNVNLRALQIKLANI